MYFERLQAVRKKHKLTQDDVAAILGTSRQQISKWENGQQNMGVDKLVLLAKYYNISTDYLLGLSDTPRELKP